MDPILVANEVETSDTYREIPAGGVCSGVDMGTGATGGNAPGGRTLVFSDDCLGRCPPLGRVVCRLGRTGYVHSCQNHSPFCQVCLKLT